MPDQPLLKSSHRWLRLSVRGLIVVVLVIGAGLGWIVRSSRTQREPVGEIERAGGLVSYDWEWKDGQWVGGSGPWAPRLLVDLVGVDYFAHVYDVCLNTTEANMAIEHIGRLAQLRNLIPQDSSITDTGLAQILESPIPVCRI